MRIIPKSLLDLSKRHVWKWEPDQNEPRNGILRLGERRWYTQERYWIFLGLIMFSAYLVGVSNTILSIPISAILAVLVFPYLLVPQERLAELAFYTERIFANRRQLLNQLADDLALNRLKSKLEQLLVTFSAGKINPSEYDQSVTVLQKEINHLEHARTIKDISANEFVLTFGPEKILLDNAFLGARWALFFQIPVLFLLFNGSALDDELSPWIQLIAGVFVFIVRWVTIGFFFGLFYEYLRENNGIRKALTVTLGIMVCTLPYRLLESSWSVSTIQALILEISLTVILLVMLGIMFDRETLRRHGFSTSYLRVVTSDFTSLAYVSSLLVPVITVIIPTVITGQFGQIITAIVKDVLPAITAIPLPK